MVHQKWPGCFGEKLWSKLINEWKIVPNKYDKCMVNEMVEGKQLTVAWHVDDLKLSHVDENAIEEFLHDMESEFGKET